MTSISELGSGIKFWRRGRDPLVEQTLSFVKGIAASNPAELEPPQERYGPQLTKRADSDFMIAERAEFSRRVLQFRDRQHKIRWEREAHYDEIWEKTRLTLGNMKAGSAL
jgi:hypothetical protein